MVGSQGLTGVGLLLYNALIDRSLCCGVEQSGSSSGS